MITILKEKNDEKVQFASNKTAIHFFDNDELAEFDKNDEKSLPSTDNTEITADVDNDTEEGLMGTPELDETISYNKAKIQAYDDEIRAMNISESNKPLRKVESDPITKQLQIASKKLNNLGIKTVVKENYIKVINNNRIQILEYDNKCKNDPTRKNEIRLFEGINGNHYVTYYNKRNLPQVLNDIISCNTL